MCKANSQKKIAFCVCATNLLAPIPKVLPPIRMKAFSNTVISTIVLTIVISIGLTNSAMAQDKPQPTLPSIELKVAGKTLNTELASTPNQRYMGLSFRKSLAENEAMLFVYAAEEQLTFTMRNTLIPLSIAYISEDLVIQEIVHMPVGPNQIFPSKAPAKFALEVNQGWFERSNVGIGEKISLAQ